MEHPEPGASRFDFLEPYGRVGLSTFWLFLLPYVALLVFGNTAIRVFAAIMLGLNVGGLLLANRSGGQYVEVLSDHLRIRLGVGPPFNVEYREVAFVRKASVKLGPFGWLLASLVQLRTGTNPFVDNTEIGLNGRKWIFVLIPFPFLWPTKKLRLPAIDGALLEAAVNDRLGTAA